MIGRKLDPGFLLDICVCYLRVHTAQEYQTIVTVYKIKTSLTAFYMLQNSIAKKLICSLLLPLAEDVSG
jgi:hypothetical protein